MTPPREWRRDGYTISTDRARLDVGLIHDFLANRSYWAAGEPREVVERALENSIVFGLYDEAGQVGFARVVTDRATFAWLADVFVVERARGRGLGKWLVETVLGVPELQVSRRWLLGTRDAHELYRRFGFHAPENPGRFMERRPGRR